MAVCREFETIKGSGKAHNFSFIIISTYSKLCYDSEMVGWIVIMPMIWFWPDYITSLIRVRIDRL